MLDLNKITLYRSLDESAVKKKAAKLWQEEIKQVSVNELVRIIDFAFLGEDETPKTIEDKFILIRKLYDANHAFRYAAVCVYPNYVRLAKSYLKNTNSRVATVTGNFPTGQGLLKSKLLETRHAIDEGADEIDYIYQPGNMLDENYQQVMDELEAVKEVCKQTTLKVILETGLLPGLKEVKLATEVAMRSGADFIKSSTGKTAKGVDPEVAYVMMQAVKSYHEETGKKVGVKLSGGIASKEEAIRYWYMMDQLLGREWNKSDLFRIGAGNMALKLLNKELQHLQKEG